MLNDLVSDTPALPAQPDSTTTMRLRSPLLVRVDNDDSTRGGKSPAWAAVRVLVLLVVVGLLVLFPLLPLLPRLEALAPLYALHDTVFVRVRGELFTRGFPNSLLFWGVVATVIGLLAASWLAGRSLFTRPAQAETLRAWVRRPGMHGTLRATAFGQDLRAAPSLLTAAAEDARTQAVLDLSAHRPGGAPADAARLFAAQTEFALRLRHDAPKNSAERATPALRPLRALADWHHDLLLLLAYGDLNDAGVQAAVNALIDLLADLPPLPDPDSLPEPALDALSGESTALADETSPTPTTPEPTPASIENTLDTRDAFAARSLTRDVYDLLRLTREQYRWLNIPPAPSRPALLVTRLLDSLDARRARLDRAAAAFQHQMMGERVNAAALRVPGEAGVRAQAGQVSATIALHFAWLIRNSAPAAAFLDALEGVAWLSDMDGDMGDDMRGEGAAGWAELAGTQEARDEQGDAPSDALADVLAAGLHAAGAARLLALLRARELESAAQGWAGVVGQGESARQFGRDLNAERQLARQMGQSGLLAGEGA